MKGAVSWRCEGPENKDGDDGDVPFAMIFLDYSLPRKTLLMHLEASMIGGDFNPYQRTDSRRPLPKAHGYFIS